MNRCVAIVQYNLGHDLDGLKASFAKLQKTNSANLNRIRIYRGREEVSSTGGFKNVNNFLEMIDANRFYLEFLYE